MVAERVVDSDTAVLNAEVTTMYTPLRTIHASALSAIAIVEHLTGQTSKNGAFFGLECE